MHVLLGETITAHLCIVGTMNKDQLSEFLTADLIYTQEESMEAMNRMRIPIETSARHVHLCQKDFEALFGEGARPTPLKYLSQPGQYLSQERVTVIGPKGQFENVGILGPLRKESQVEVSQTDTRKLGLPGIIRQSGDIVETPGCILQAGDKQVELEKGVIVAKRHIHMTPTDAIRFQVHDNDLVCVVAKSYERYLIFADVVVRIDKSFKLAMHVDTDEANAVAGDGENYGLIVKLFDYRYFSMDQWMEELEQGIYRNHQI